MKLGKDLGNEESVVLKQRKRLVKLAVYLRLLLSAGVSSICASLL